MLGSVLSQSQFLVHPRDKSKLEYTSKLNPLLTALSGDIFPIRNGIPWLFFPNRNYESHWLQKLSELHAYHQYRIQELSTELAQTQSIGSTGVSARSRIRLKKLLNAFEVNLETVNSLWSIPEKKFSKHMGSLPSHQSLGLYNKNIFRDWAWETNENQWFQELVTKYLERFSSINSALIIGCGAGRLVVDIQRSKSWDYTIGIDINPLLIQLGQRLNLQEEFQFCDFNQSAIELCDVVTEYTLKSPYEKVERAEFILGDLAELPIASGSQECVITPWVVDVVNLTPEQIATRINSILKTDGIWINTGPLGYSGQRDEDHYVKEDFQEMAVRWGFKIEEMRVDTMSYLSHQTETSSRREKVLNFVFRKVKDVDVKQIKSGVPWLEDWTQPIALTDLFAQQKIVSRMQGDLFNSIDGRVSIQTMIQLFMSHYKMDANLAQDFIVSTLKKYSDKSGRI